MRIFCLPWSVLGGNQWKDRTRAFRLHGSHINERQELDKSELVKLRRFSLTVALVVLTYSVAGIVPNSQPDITLIGLKFHSFKGELATRRLSYCIDMCNGAVLLLRLHAKPESLSCSP